jgi:hypothetical protein
MEKGEVEPPFKPRVGSETDIANFDTTFTSEPATLTPPAPSELSEAAMADDEFSDFSFVNVSKLPPTLVAELEKERVQAAAAAQATAAMTRQSGRGAEKEVPEDAEDLEGFDQALRLDSEVGDGEEEGNIDELLEAGSSGAVTGSAELPGQIVGEVAKGDAEVGATSGSATTSPTEDTAASTEATATVTS